MFMQRVWTLRRSTANFIIPPSRLHGIEIKNKIPSIHRLYALALIYGPNPE
jgi:hypothetical protein